MTHVYVVQHVHVLDEEEEEENVKMIGVYTTRELAEAAVKRLRQQPGFCDAPDGFHIDLYELNRDHWDEGYITVRWTLD